jgi:hypothetical protein
VIDSPREVHEYLSSSGFRLVGPSRGLAASYEGPIGFRGKEVRVRLDIPDWDFKSRPVVRLKERPDGLDGYRPHLGLGRNLCYLDRESVQMDRYQPAMVIARCLLKASETLEDIAGNRQRLDVQGEFLANWIADEYPLLVWKQATRQRLLSIQKADLPHHADLFVITDDLAKTRATLGDSKFTEAFENCVCEFVVDARPSFDPDHWPPKRLKEVLDWLGGWNPALRKALLGKLESVWTQERSFLAVIVSTPSGRFGFSFTARYASPNDRRRLAKKPSDRRQWILTKNPEITRFVCNDLSPGFIHTRNQRDGETLGGKRIAVVGCGAVGGYLATFLARLGAGWEGGSLKLYDTQQLRSENLGRHVLSVADLFRNKAEGVADLVRREFPYLDVRARPVDATEALDLFDAKLVIDASGSSAISSALNARNVELLKRGDASPAVLHVWVEGQGEAARGLLVDSLKHMCFECQFLRQPGQPLIDRFPLVKEDRHSGRIYPGDCSSYMPFAVSAATSAAGLGLDMARDWATGNPRWRFRSRRLDLEATENRHDSSPQPLAGCPACRKQ